MQLKSNVTTNSILELIRADNCIPVIVLIAKDWLDIRVLSWHGITDEYPASEKLEYNR